MFESSSAIRKSSLSVRVSPSPSSASRNSSWDAGESSGSRATLRHSWGRAVAVPGPSSVVVTLPTGSPSVGEWVVAVSDGDRMLSVVVSCGVGSPSGGLFVGSPPGSAAGAPIHSPEKRHSARGPSEIRTPVHVFAVVGNIKCLVGRAHDSRRRSTLVVFYCRANAPLRITFSRSATGPRDRSDRSPPGLEGSPAINPTTRTLIRHLRVHHPAETAVESPERLLRERQRRR